jgi:hypothetical protein
MTFKAMCVGGKTINDNFNAGSRPSTLFESSMEAKNQASLVPGPLLFGSIFDDEETKVDLSRPSFLADGEDTPLANTKETVRKLSGREGKNLADLAKPI